MLFSSSTFSKCRWLLLHHFFTRLCRQARFFPRLTWHQWNHEAAVGISFNSARAQGSFICSERQSPVSTSHLCHCQGPMGLFCSSRALSQHCKMNQQCWFQFGWEINCSKIPAPPAAPYTSWILEWYWTMGYIVTGVLLDALHPLAPQFFIRGEFLRELGIHLWLAEIIMLKALMRPSWASKLLNLYEFWNSWGVNICGWENGQVTTWVTTAGAAEDKVAHRTPPLTLQSCVDLQPHTQVGINSSTAEVAPVWVCPPLAFPPAFRVAGLMPLLFLPLLQYSVQRWSVLETGWFLPYQEGDLTLTSNGKFKGYTVEPGDHSKWLCLTLHCPPSSKSPLKAGYYHTILPGVLQTYFCSLCLDSRLTGPLPTSLVKILACARPLQIRFCSQVGDCKALPLHNEIQKPSNFIQMLSNPTTCIWNCLCQHVLKVSSPVTNIPLPNKGSLEYERVINILPLRHQKIFPVWLEPFQSFKRKTPHQWTIWRI